MIHESKSARRVNAGAQLAGERRRFGYRRLHVLLQQEGLVVNRKRTQSVHREEGLTVRKQSGRKKAVGTRAPIFVEAIPNARWSVDVVHHQRVTARRLRIFNVVMRQCRSDQWRAMAHRDKGMPGGGG